MGALSLLLTTGSVFAQEKFIAAETDAIKDQYIVVFADGVALTANEAPSAGFSVDEVAAQLADLYGGTVERTWKHGWQGFQIRLGETQAQLLAFDPLVERVKQDQRVISLNGSPLSCYGFDDLKSRVHSPEIQRLKGSSQVIVCDDPDPRNPSRDCSDNWGLDRIDQTSGDRDGFYNYNQFGTGVHVYVLDTGIEADHQEFFVGGPPFTRVIGGTNAILGGDPDNTTDCYGHGTHVAGIIGGDTSGVAKYVWLHPVKFVDSCPGEPVGGTVGDTLEALEWILDNHQTPAVVNWSGGNGSASLPPYNDPDVRAKVRELLDAGVSFVQAAGNQNDDVNGEDACERSLGGAPELDEVIVVGGTDANQASVPIDGRWIRETNDPSYTLCTNPTIKDCGSNSGACVWTSGRRRLTSSRPSMTT